MSRFDFSKTKFSDAAGLYVSPADLEKVMKDVMSETLWNGGRQDPLWPGFAVAEKAAVDQMLANTSDKLRNICEEDMISNYSPVEKALFNIFRSGDTFILVSLALVCRANALLRLVVEQIRGRSYFRMRIEAKDEPGIKERIDAEYRTKKFIRAACEAKVKIIDERPGFELREFAEALRLVEDITPDQPCS